MKLLMPSVRGCFKSCSGFARLQSPMALSACIDDRTNIACFGLRALGLFARARADDQLLKHPLRESAVQGLGQIFRSDMMNRMLGCSPIRVGGECESGKQGNRQKRFHCEF